MVNSEDIQTNKRSLPTTKIEHWASTMLCSSKWVVERYVPHFLNTIRKIWTKIRKTMIKRSTTSIIKITLIMIACNMKWWCKDKISILSWRANKEAWLSTLLLQENKVAKSKDRKPFWLLVEFQLMIKTTIKFHSLTYKEDQFLTQACSITTWINSKCQWPNNQLKLWS